MNSVARKVKDYPAISQVSVTSEKITASMTDGREVSIPTAWFPRLSSATDAQRSHFEVSPGGYGIHWPDIDEDISVRAFFD